jgi:protein-disulfide isomerase
MFKGNRQNGYALPIAIVAAGLLIGSALYFGGNNSSSNHNRRSAVIGLPEVSGVEAASFRMPNGSDHTRGNPDAKIAIVEFSDFECPFCARLHPTLERIVEEDENIKWIYRHFPLNSHSKAFGAAVASECIAKLSGNEGFWNFADFLFANQRQLGDNFYKDFAVQNGISESEFNECLKDRAVASEVQADLNEVIKASGWGTPFSVIVTEEGKLIPFSGALPYEHIKSLLAQTKDS